MDRLFGSVERRSERDIERLANVVRQVLEVEPHERLAMQPVLEFAIDEMVDDASFAVLPDQEMNGAEGRTDWHRPVITLAASTYAGLSKGQDRARMTVAHELGHLLMHSQQPVYYYRNRSKDRRVDPEWQADFFAASLLMPRHAFKRMRTVSQARKAFGVSRAAALHRARYLNVNLVDDIALRSKHKKKGHGMTRAP